MLLFSALLLRFGVVSGWTVRTTATTTQLSSPESHKEQQRLLIEKSKEFCTIYPSSWSNRIGKVIAPVYVDNGDTTTTTRNHNNVYVADRSFMWFGINVGGRCTIIELPSSNNDEPNLFIHSPISLCDYDQTNDDDSSNNNRVFKTTLESIGNVKYIVSPNYEHVKYAQMWYDAYKDDPRYNIQMYGCPGLAERIPSISWYAEIPYHYRPNSWTKIESAVKSNDNTINTKIDWDTSILEPIHLDIEMNPFNGKPFFNEVLFYHKPSKSLLTTDFLWNYPSSDGITNHQLGYDGSWELAPNLSTDNRMPLSSSLWKFGMDRIYLPFYNHLMIPKQYQKEYMNLIDHIMNVWDIETIIPCHGDIIRGKDNVRKAFQKSFAFHLLQSE